MEQLSRTAQEIIKMGSDERRAFHTQLIGEIINNYPKACVETTDDTGSKVYRLRVGGAPIGNFPNYPTTEYLLPDGVVTVLPIDPEKPVDLEDKELPAVLKRLQGIHHSGEPLKDTTLYNVPSEANLQVMTNTQITISSLENQSTRTRLKEALVKSEAAGKEADMSSRFEAARKDLFG